MTVQRDFGDRTNRKHARIKYCVEDYGPEFFREQVEERCVLARMRAYVCERSVRARASVCVCV